MKIPNGQQLVYCAARSLTFALPSEDLIALVSLVLFSNCFLPVALVAWLGFPHPWGEALPRGFLHSYRAWKGACHPARPQGRADDGSCVLFVDSVREVRALESTAKWAFYREKVQFWCKKNSWLSSL